MQLITENGLDTWVRGNAKLAQGIIVELIARLVVASSPKPTDRRFPLGDAIGQHGPDGYLDAIIAHDPYVPMGKSYWEIGTGGDSKKKCNDDYLKQQQEILLFSIIIFTKKNVKHRSYNRNENRVKEIRKKRKYFFHKLLAVISCRFLLGQSSMLKCIKRHLTTTTSSTYYRKTRYFAFRRKFF